MDALNKIPRSVLVLIAFFGLGACGVLLSTARADLNKFKDIAEDAFKMSENNKDDISELKTDFKSFRVEYKQDQRELDNKITEILRAIKQ
jgi:hypothetical protein